MIGTVEIYVRKCFPFQCITEAERYSAKGYVPKPEKNKGAQKQEMWTECIQELSERPNFDFQTKQVLQRIASQSNVPRKKPKFVNFLKSSMRSSHTNAEKIWTIIEEGLEEFKKKSAPPLKSETATTSPESTTANGNEQSTESNINKANETTPVTQSTSTSLTLESVFVHALGQSDLEKTTKKTLKKLQKRSHIPLNVISPKQKKFIKFLREEFQLDGESSGKIYLCLLHSIHALSSEANSVPNASKKRKNSDDNESAEAKKSKTEVNIADSTTDANGESTFDWQKHILRIFNKNNQNNQISVDSLKSKVIKKFLKSIGEDDSNNAQYDKKFKKILKKMPTLSLTNGVVQLKA